jgi:hypothetical protein
MIIFGHSFIKNEDLYHITDIDDIYKTPPNSIIYIKFDEKNLDIIEYLQKNDIRFALEVDSIKEIIYGSNLNASYLCVKKEFAKTAQNLAESYLFDSKILAHIQNEDELETLALEGIDGVLFPTAIVKV